MDPNPTEPQDLAEALAMAMSSLGGMTGPECRAAAPRSETMSAGAFGEIHSGANPRFGERKLRYWMFENATEGARGRIGPSVWLKPMTSQPQRGRNKERALPLEPGWLPSLRREGGRSRESWILLQLPSVRVSRPDFRNKFDYVKTLPGTLIEEARRRLREIREERKERGGGKSRQP